MEKEIDSHQLCGQSTKGPRVFALITQCAVGLTSAAKPPAAWTMAFYISLVLVAVFIASVAWSVDRGIGVWGNMHPVAWGWPIVNFVFWIGIAHAGTLISAILLLLRQKWRTAINRFAETMTVFAVLCASIYPIIHLGRPWFFYWLIPYPNKMGMWPQFRSPLTWDAFAVCTYAMVSLMFLYIGMIPDLATFRDREKNPKRRFVYRLLALGWCGSSRQWHKHERAYLLLAGLATPLVISVHSIVSFDFSVSQLPGWHTTIFPPYFVCGAIFGGLAMLVVLAVPARHFFNLREVIQVRHFDAIAKIMLAMSLLIGYAYAIEVFFAWYGNSHFEQFAFVNRAFGPYAWAYWIMLLCNLLAPQVFWFKKARTNLNMVLCIGILVTIGMWFERFVIVCTSQSRDFIPANWGAFAPTLLDFFTFVGSIGLFLFMFLLFCRYLPIISISEVKLESPFNRSIRTESDFHENESEVNLEKKTETKDTGWQGFLKRSRYKVFTAGRACCLFAAVGFVCSIAAFSVGGGIQDGYRSFLESYYTTFIFFLSISLGALLWLLITYIVRSRWTDNLRPILENFASTLPILALLFVPILAALLKGNSDLFPWISKTASINEQARPHSAIYLSKPFFGIRWFVYFALWMAVDWYVKKESRSGQTAAGVQHAERMQGISGISMIALALSITFAAVDLLVAPSRGWSSSVIGVYFFSGCILGILGSVVLVIFMMQQFSGKRELTAAQTDHDLGKMLFAFVLFWGYIAFSQFLIIWYANIPSETIWYRVRLENYWRYLTLLLVCGHFLLPFAGLLTKRSKRRRSNLVFWAAWIVLMHYFDIYWLVMPALNSGRTPRPFLDLLCLAGIGGIFCAAVAYARRRSVTRPMDQNAYAASGGKKVPVKKDALSHG